MLARLGYQLLNGPDAPPPKRIGKSIALARQPHTRALADFLVHALVAAHLSGVEVVPVAPENSVCLHLGEDCLFPDATIQVRGADGRTYQFYIEVDNGSQSITSSHDLECWQRKLRFYEGLRADTGQQFRVLIVSTRSDVRLTHLLGTAAALARVPARSLWYGATLEKYLASIDPLFAPCWRNHRGEAVALLPVTVRQRERSPELAAVSRALVVGSLSPAGSRDGDVRAPPCVRSLSTHRERSASPGPDWSRCR